MGESFQPYWGIRKTAAIHAFTQNLGHLMSNFVSQYFWHRSLHIYIYIDIVYIYSIGLNHEKPFLLEPYRDPVVVWKVRNLPGSSSCSEAGERRVADGVSLACGTGAPKKNPRFHHWKRDLRLGTFSFFLRSQQSLLLMVANITHHQSFAIGITRLLC